MNHQCKRAFTLLELAIVLTIIGLIAGGIVAGSSMIENAKLRAIAAEYNEIQTSANTFYTKYSELPGDMTNAESLWGTMSTGTCPNATAGTGTESCNGDGDGEVIQENLAGVTSEGYQFWKHMSNAAMYPGKYTGVAGPNAPEDDLIDINVPASKWDNAAWNVEHSLAITHLFNHRYRNYYDLGAKQINNDTDDPAFTPTQAWNIDKKVDDGKPGKGNVMAKHITTCTDASSDTDYDADYLLISDVIGCALIFIQLK